MAGFSTGHFHLYMAPLESPAFPLIPGGSRRLDATWMRHMIRRRQQREHIDDLLNEHARAHPDIFWPSSNGYGAIWTSTCIDTAVFFPTATETETRYALIARDYQREYAVMDQISGGSTCRCSKNVAEHIAIMHDVSIRTLRTAIAHASYGQDKLTALSS